MPFLKYYEGATPGKKRKLTSEEGAEKKKGMRKRDKRGNLTRSGSNNQNS